MVMVTVVVFAYQFKAACAVAEIKPFDHAHFFKHVHRAIDCREVTSSPALLHFREDFLVCQWMGMPAQDFQNRGTGPGDFARLASQTVLKRGQILLFAGMRMTV